MLQTWNPDRLATINGSLWSVALEAQLYLTLPLLLMFARRWGLMPLVVGTALLSILLTSFDLPGQFGAALTDTHNLPVRLVQFTVGLGCAWLVVHRRTPRSSVLWCVAVLGGLVAVGWSTAGIAPAKVVIWTIPCAAAVLLITGSFGHGLSTTPLERWGLASYSFYLLHQPIVLALGHLITPYVDGAFVGLAAGLAVALPATAVASFMLYVAVERPAHLFGRSRFPIFRTMAPDGPAVTAAAPSTPSPPTRVV